jgi:amino acid permease
MRTTDSKRITLLTNFEARGTKQEEKLSGFSAFLVLFKSCVGLGIFSYPYAFGKAGYFYGMILSVFICYITTYGMYKLTVISSEIEKETNDEVLIDDYHFLAQYVAENYKSERLGIVISGFAVWGTILNNVSIIIASIIEVSTHLESFIGIDQIYIKFGIISFYLVVSTYALKPEKLKIFSAVSGFLIIMAAVAMYIDNIRILLPSNQISNLTYEKFNLANTGIFLGMAGFAYEACGTIFTVRMAMKDPHYTPKLITYVFTFIGAVFIMLSLSFYFAYGVEGLRPIAFEFYPQDTRPFMYLIGVVFCVCLVLFVPMLNISNSDLLEHYEFVGLHIRGSDGLRSNTRLVIFRLLLFIVSAAPAFITNKIELVMNIEGSLVIPFISYYIPVALNYMNEKNHGRPILAFQLIHDSFVFICGVGFLILGLTYSIQSILNPDK